MSKSAATGPGSKENSVGLFRGEAIDCDVHVAVPSMNVLTPFLDDYWREAVTVRGLDRHSMNLTGQAANAPINARPDWRPSQGKPGTDLPTLQKQLDTFGTKFAILNCMYGAQALHHEDMAAAFCGAVNDWIAKEWLDKDARLRASIVLPIQNPQNALCRCSSRRWAR
jgi:predicted TIM-barrel fold metal-dependent hydrolase